MTIQRRCNITEYLNDEIISGIRNGSEDMFCYIYEKYFAALNKFAFHIIASEESKDIVHDIFIKLWANHNKLPQDVNIKSYLYTSVKNRSLDYLKHLGIEDKNQKRIIESILSVEDAWKDDDDAVYDKLYKCIEQLPSQQLNVVKLKIEGKSYQEIAEELNISKKTVNNHLTKTYNYIRKNLVVFIFFISHIGIFIK